MRFDLEAESHLAALTRIHLTYVWRHGRMPKLNDPSRFTELVQLRKLLDRDHRMPKMADKVAIKSTVANRLGHEWVIPTLWSGDVLPAELRFERPVVVKSRHGCNQTAVVSTDAEWNQARRRARRWMASSSGVWLDEWLYRQIPRGLLIEPFIGTALALPVDYKIYVFHGQASHVQAHIDRASRHRWVVHDLDWRPLANDAPKIKRPTALAAMIEAAEELASDFDFARVDFYQPMHQPLFGEITFYPGSGLDPFDPPELDLEMGRLWLRPPSANMASTDSAITSLAA